MVNKEFEKFFRHDTYSYADIKYQIKLIEKQYNNVISTKENNWYTTYVKLQPTENSIIYTIKVCCRVNDKIVKIYVVEPQIKKTENLQIPHMYSDDSLCLYFPKHKEWSKNDNWVDTLIPWASLWLFYYEVWLETGEWLGGGKHLRQNKKKKNSFNCDIQ